MLWDEGGIGNGVVNKLLEMCNYSLICLQYFLGSLWPSVFFTHNIQGAPVWSLQFPSRSTFF